MKTKKYIFFCKSAFQLQKQTKSCTKTKKKSHFEGLNLRPDNM
jgi:hypothetical protein